MKTISFRSLAAIALTTLLTACGAGQQDAQSPMQLASAVQSDLGVTASVAATPVAASTGPAVAPATGPNHPTPDCAAEGCASLRIIDGNAEAFRVDAMRRAAADQS
jgi:hypothetical protein